MRFISPLLRQRFEFRLRPLSDVAPLDQSGARWRSYGADPSFLLDSGRGGCPGGTVLIESTLERTGENRVAKLYFNSGSGFDAAGWVFVPVSAAGTIREVLHLPAHVAKLRWDPMESTGEIHQGPIVLTAITWLEGAFRMAREILRLRAERDGSGGRPGWRDLAGLLANLETEYAASAQSRNQGGASPALQRRSPVIGRPRPNAGRLFDPMQAQHVAQGPYRFALDLFNDHEISGWVVDTRRPEASVDIDLYLNGELAGSQSAARY